MLRLSLSDSMLLTIFIPGAICLAGIGWIAFPYMWSPLEPEVGRFLEARGTDLSGIGVLITGVLAVAVLLAYLLAVFLGTLVAVVVGYIEAQILDRLQARKLGLSPDEFENQWHRYLDSLEKAHNSYVTKQVTAFLFQARSSLALLILVVLVLASSTRPAAIWVPAILLVAVLFKAAIDDHSALAAFRSRRFADDPGATAKPEEALGILVNTWCKRGELAPLRLILPTLTEGSFQINADGFPAYKEAIAYSLGSQFVDFAQVIKIYRSTPENETRYSPSTCVGCEKVEAIGWPDLDRATTSHIERQNLTVRMSMRRMTRLTNAFSKKWMNLQHAYALQFAYYNFCRPHTSLQKCTPAMAAGIANHVWSIQEIISA